MDKLNLRNHFVLPPLDMRMALFDGTVSLNDLEFHRQRSRTVGMDVVGSAFISAEGNTALGSISISRDEDVEGLGELAKVIHQNHAKAIIQLVHAGRLASPQAIFGKKAVAPSTISAPWSQLTPQALTRDAIYKIIDQYANALKRAMAAGFDGIEIHGANGFLPQQFISRNANCRDDQFGGTLENRFRFVKLLMQRLRETISQFGNPTFILGYRLSPEEYEEGGLKLGETLQLARLLEQLGIDYLSLSLHDFMATPRTFDTEVPIVKLFNAAVNLPVMVAGQVDSANKLKQAQNFSTLVGVGRPLIHDPNWLNKVTAEKPYKPERKLAASEIGVAQTVYQVL
ncbi:NADH:flavin oxidoreductase [Pediococcus acidilactici]|nr:NADH:flavin oxidoreductase [Pediococcus acidilactici]UWF34073.1 NADH:flavin oxidoreductase [Pediococcus acidilactici]